MRKFLFFLLVVLIQNTFSQNNNSTEVTVKIINHTVAFGETMRMISLKYHVSPSEIYRLNKGAADGLYRGMILQIPVPINMDLPTKEIAEVKKIMENASEEEVIDSKNNVIAISDMAIVNELKEESNIIIHKVLPKETLYSLSIKYQVTVDEIIVQNNELLKNGMKIGQTLTIKKK